MTDSGVGGTSMADLVAVAVAVALVAALVLSPLGAVRPVAIVVGLPFVLLVPGYALVSSVFPGAGEAPMPTTATSWLGRLGLSVGGSVLAVAVVGGLLDFSVWGSSERESLSGCVCSLWPRQRSPGIADWRSRPSDGPEQTQLR